LERAKQLSMVQGIAEKDLAAGNLRSADRGGALKAARDAVAVFGKSQARSTGWCRRARSTRTLVVPSPISGRVTARTAAPGDFVQPGNAPAPYSVADISRIWMNASVTESDMPLVRKGQEIHVSVMAFPGRVFDGEISMVGPRSIPSCIGVWCAPRSMIRSTSCCPGCSRHSSSSPAHPVNARLSARRMGVARATAP
jgi:cobalt-zinc-cadmium efflux system membrane fusion protein